MAGMKKSRKPHLAHWHEPPRSVALKNPSEIVMFFLDFITDLGIDSANEELIQDDDIKYFLDRLE
jgi:hypothetical protein